MDSHYYEMIKETEVWIAWKDGLCKGFVIGTILGATIIGFIGMSVCPRV